MTEIFERRAFFAFAKFFAIAALLVAGVVFPVNAQEGSDGPVARTAGKNAKFLSFYGTGRADWATVATPTAEGQPIVWKIRKNQAGPEVSTTFNFGLFNDVISPGSYTADATYDAGIWRRRGASLSAETWIDPFDDGPGTPYTVIPFGSGTNPVPPSTTPTGDNAGRNADYDGDGIEDVTMIRVASNVLQWWIRPSSNPSQIRIVPFGNLVTGQQTFAFEGADFTGDGRDEIVVARSVNLTGAATWFVGDSITGQQILQLPFGDWDIDFLINPADYTGDGIADIVVWRAGGANSSQWVWYVRNTATGAIQHYLFGIGDPNFTNMDLPIRGDYDGDNIDDIAVWRPSTQTFWVRASSNGGLIIQQWGAGTDTPLGTFFTF
jgi:hypothetical protein